LPPNWSPLSSVKISSGTIHLTSSVVSPFMTASKSIFCFAHVRMKFVSSNIFMGVLINKCLNILLNLIIDI
jgi:ABC-type transport system involved in cytochrome c biogenesis permease subunit